LVVAFFGLALLFQAGVANNLYGLALFKRRFYDMNAFEVVRLSIPFLVGSLMWLFRDRVPLRAPGAIVAAAGLVTAVGLRLPLLAYVAVPYLAVYVGTRPSDLGRRFHRFGDPSYGIYIYSFPIQQVLVQTSWIGLHPWGVVVGSTLLSATVGYASWYAIERPATLLRRRSTSSQRA
jgi:hypothetical protein